MLLVGNIASEPYWQASSQEKWLCFTLVTREVISSPKGDIDHHETHQVKIEGNNTSLKRIELAKGRTVFVQGKICTQSFVDPTNVKRYKTDIVASIIEHHAP